jgi:hypothetical protein
MKMFNDSQPGRMHLAQATYRPAGEIGMPLACDRCHVAPAKVEVITRRGSVFLCQHHGREHGASIIAAGHWIRTI